MCRYANVLLNEDCINLYNNGNMSAVHLSLFSITLNFEIFSPTGGTRCTEVRLLHAKFQPISARVGAWCPQN